MEPVDAMKNVHVTTELVSSGMAMVTKCRVRTNRRIYLRIGTRARAENEAIWARTSNAAVDASTSMLL
jgi:hypothetical protein